MEAKVQVEDRKEAELIRRGLADNATRALVKIIGALSTLPSVRAKKRTLTFVADHFAECDSQ